MWTLEEVRKIKLTALNNLAALNLRKTSSADIQFLVATLHNSNDVVNDVISSRPTDALFNARNPGEISYYERYTRMSR